MKLSNLILSNENRRDKHLRLRKNLYITSSMTLTFDWWGTAQKYPNFLAVTLNNRSTAPISIIAYAALLYTEHFRRNFAKIQHTRLRLWHNETTRICEHNVNEVFLKCQKWHEKYYGTPTQSNPVRDASVRKIYYATIGPLPQGKSTKSNTTQMRQQTK